MFQSIYDRDFLHSSPAFVHIASQWNADETWPSLASLSQDCVVQFVPPIAKSSLFADQYVVRIAQKGLVSTRTRDWHDLCNALTWRVFPKSKVALNERHYQALCKRKAKWDIQQPRSSEEDICTLINENAIVIAYTQEKDADAIQNFAWKTLFWDRREGLDRRMELFFWGHALLDKARTPYIGMTGHAILIHVEDMFFQKPIQERIKEMDARLCGVLLEQKIQRTRDLSPFPVLGFPGFDPRAEEKEFYDLTHYFRRGRRIKGIS